VHKVVQSKKRPVDVQKMLATAVAVHLAQLGILAVLIAQHCDFIKKSLVAKVEFFLVKGTREHAQHLLEQLREKFDLFR
tara:strand:+ start:387 stop:623 length:237 start_codon:yes stop_codon:yes gene_type:complete